MNLKSFLIFLLTFIVMFTSPIGFSKGHGEKHERHEQKHTHLHGLARAQERHNQHRHKKECHHCINREHLRTYKRGSVHVPLPVVPSIIIPLPVLPKIGLPISMSSNPLDILLNKTTEEVKQKVRESIAD